MKINKKEKLKNIGINNVNSISYNIKKIQIIEKLKLICKLISEVDLKPHS